MINIMYLKRMKYTCTGVGGPKLSLGYTWNFFATLLHYTRVRTTTYRWQGVGGADGRVGSGLLQERFVLVERCEPVQQGLQHGGHLMSDGRFDGHALMSDFSHVGHDPFVAEVVRELVSPLGQELHEPGHEPRQLILKNQKNKRWQILVNERSKSNNGYKGLYKNKYYNRKKVKTNIAHGQYTRTNDCDDRSVIKYATTTK